MHRKTSRAGIVVWVLACVFLCLCFLTVPPTVGTTLKTERTLPETPQTVRQEQEVLEQKAERMKQDLERVEQELEEITVLYEIRIRNEGTEHGDQIVMTGTISCHDPEHGHH